MKNDDTFNTSDFGTAVFLYVKGFRLMNIKWIEARRASFFFENSPKIEKVLQKFNFAETDDPEVMVDIRKIQTATKLLKDKMYGMREEM